MDNLKITSNEETIFKSSNKSRWKQDKFSKICLIFCSFLLILSVSGVFFPENEENKLNAKKIMIEKSMKIKQADNDTYRNELNILEPRVEELKNLIQQNKFEWNKYDGQRKEIDEMIIMIKGLEGDNPFSESNPSMGK